MMLQQKKLALTPTILQKFYKLLSFKFKESRYNIRMSQLDVLLITPPSRLEVYQNLSGDYAAIETPVWSMLIAKYLSNINYNVEILDALHNLTFERQGLERSDGEKFLAVNFSKIAIEKGFGRLMICNTREGDPVSASVFLLDKIRWYYLIGATNPEYRKYGVGSFTLFHQLKKCFEDGLNEVDFIGINSPQRGYFKTSFNAEPKIYFEMTYK